MLKLVLPITLFAAVALGVTAFAVSSSSPTERDDCPGKIVCPLTGELVCEDQCPVDEKTSTEDLAECCPGRE